MLKSRIRPSLSAAFLQDPNFCIAASDHLQCHSTSIPTVHLYYLLFFLFFLREWGWAGGLGRTFYSPLIVIKLWCCPEQHVGLGVTNSSRSGVYDLKVITFLTVYAADQELGLQVYCQVKIYMKGLIKKGLYN